MKKALILFLVSAMFIYGCGQEGSMDQGSAPEEMADMDNADMDKGDISVESSGLNTGEWCPEGGEWKYASDMQGASGEWKVIGLETSGEYKGLCHVRYLASANGQNMQAEYWFTEDGKSGYYEMDVNGQKIKQEWRAE